MPRVHQPAILARLLSAVLLAAVAQVAPAPACADPQPPAKTAATSATPPAAATPNSDEARKRMLSLFEEYCLNRLANTESTDNALGQISLPKASAAEAEAALKGRHGTAWSADSADGHFVLTVWGTPIAGCAVTGKIAEDASTRAGFDIVITMYGGSHEYGDLVKRPVRQGQVAGRPASLQLILASPSGTPRQAFANLGVTNPDGTTTVRMVREFQPTRPPSPPIASKPALTSPQSQPAPKPAPKPAPTSAPKP
jgi:hypothetical protein